MSVMDLSSVIASFSTGTYEVQRPLGESTYDLNGRIVEPTFDELEVTACVQPTSGADLRRMPEGLQTEEVKTVWAPFKFLVRDQVVIDGEPWEVQRVERWAELGNYWRAFATKLNQN